MQRVFIHDLTGEGVVPQTIGSVSTVIAKPTKLCNATCDYCSAPPSDKIKWSLDDFKRYYDKMLPHLVEGAYWIWHGGEPMLQGPDFFIKAYEHSLSMGKHINFSMQSNILLYNSNDWKDIFMDIFNGGVSTSYDPDMKHRKYQHSTNKYKNTFFEKMDLMLEDKIRVFVISTFNNPSAHLMGEMYDIAKEYEDKGTPFDLRFNYRYPAGRAKSELNSIDLITPERYGEQLLKIYEKWMVDTPKFSVTPLNLMLGKALGSEEERCPWTNNCGGKFFGLEPNGDIYNCSEFADLDDDEFKFGNIGTHSMSEILQSKAARAIKRRRMDVPNSCLTCDHYNECRGGCARDAVLFNRGLGGKFYYCASWKMVFKRIKESIGSGEAKKLIDNTYF